MSTANTERPTGGLPPEVEGYLREHKSLTLATSSPAAVPHAATLVYVNDGLALYVCTRPDTVTAGHIDQNPAVAFTIDEYAEDWAKTRGVQGEGEARVVLSPAAIDRIVGLFQQKFRFLHNVRAAGLSIFRVTPTQLHFIDNASDGEQAGEALGMGYRRQLVYSVFRDLPPHEVETMAARLESVQVRAGKVIVRQGAPADKFFIIVEGEVEVLREDGGAARAVATLRAGQFFGEMAILRDTPRNATVRATAPTTLLAMDRDSFRALVAQSLGTTQDFDRVVQQRLSELGAAGPAGS
jgi:uncharacterized protein YhbP (UPF0306 family)